MDGPDPDEAEGRLYQDALDLSIEKVVSDVSTLLTWIEETDDLEKRRRRVEQAIELLEEMQANLDRAITSRTRR